jgi:hypothetical protein
MLPWSDWVVPSARKTGDEGEAHLHRPFDNPHDAENTARMGDKAKPLAAYRRRLCCLRERPSAYVGTAGAIVELLPKDFKHQHKQAERDDNAD